MQEYTSENSNPNIILHDCTIEKCWIENRDIVFEFDNSGFWISKNHPQNPFGETLRTGRAELRLVNIDPDFISIHVFYERRLAGITLFTTRKNISYDDFAAKINSGVWTFEFVDEYYGCRRAMFSGYIHRQRKPYHIEMQIDVFYEQSRYSWDKIYEDRTW